ncbi:hypothetical protein NRF22_06325 [Oenococcus kitaharae]|uniref:hypothetical protein n=1 Tax=Oenococcus TaxID=46254 RepID=UPI0021E7D0C3|nr:hypothetical protein [Oenococcus kitaharae]MCV3296730.1 hypothetical protein [Oenococcus kitaharae]
MKELNVKKELNKVSIALSNHGIYKDQMNTFVWNPNKVTVVNKDSGYLEHVVLSSWN